MALAAKRLAYTRMPVVKIPPIVRDMGSLMVKDTVVLTQTIIVAQAVEPVHVPRG